MKRHNPNHPNPWIAKAHKRFADLASKDGRYDESKLQDLITDLRHICGQDFDEIVNDQFTADHYREEQSAFKVENGFWETPDGARLNHEGREE